MLFYSHLYINQTYFSLCWSTKHSQATSIPRNSLFQHTLSSSIYSLNFTVISSYTHTHDAILVNIIICIRYIIDKRFVSFVFLFAFLPVRNLFCKHMSIYLAENYCLLQLYIKWKSYAMALIQKQNIEWNLCMKLKWFGMYSYSSMHLIMRIPFIYCLYFEI